MEKVAISARSVSATPATYDRVFDLLPQFVAKHNSTDTLANKQHGEWTRYSAQAFVEQVNALSLGLLHLGIQKDDKIALISANRPEWNIVDFGVQQLGAVTVPMYPTITIEDYRYIFQDAGVKLIFVGNQELYEKAKQASKELDSLIGIYTFDQLPGLTHWTEISQLATNEPIEKLESCKAAVNTDDLLTLIYTSGTTGIPKGVMLTHRNIVSNVEAVMDYVPMQAHERALSFLPLCHIYERTVLYIYMRLGVSIYYAESMETIADNLREIKPMVFTTVPRLLEKVYDKIVSKGHELTGIKRSLFFWALNLGLRYDPSCPMGWWYDQQLKLARKLIFSKWQEALGGNVRLICSGSAALQPRLARIFWAAGIPVSEGYGLTETSPVVSTSMVEPIDFRIGCVGTVIPGVEVKIADDGEILVKGPNVMKGYYNKPEATTEVIDANGWFHTGDIGEFVEGKYLKITDRKKEIFKTSGGKYIAPQLIENRLKESMLIEQAIVVGEGQKFASALLVPNFDELKKFCETSGIGWSNLSEILKNPTVLAKFQTELDLVNAKLAQYEKIKKFCLLPVLFSIEGGELTPTLKLKRKIINAKYQQLIDSMYA
jgi:long-chain acyl-CoA synthetase